MAGTEPEQPEQPQPEQPEQPEPGEPGELGEDGQLDLEERRYPSTIGGLFYLLVLVAMVVGVVLAWLDDWRLGVRVLAAGLGAAAVLRLVLPQRDAGMLAVRNRVVDVGVLLAMAGALFFLTGSIPDQPGG